MWLDPVRTTTWPKRHWPVFVELARLVAELPADPTIILVGPGGVSRPIRPLLRDAAHRKLSPLHRAVRNWPRIADHFLRRVPFIPLVSLEPGELQELITRPYQLVVVDLSRRVLDGVRREFPNAICHQVDIASGRIPAQGDIVIAYSVLTRTSDGQKAMACVDAALRPGGLLLLDDRSAQRWLPAPPAYALVSEQVFRKQS